MKTKISLSAKELPKPSTDGLLKAATARILSLVSGAVAKKSEQRTMVTYTGTSAKDLVKQVKQILSTLIEDKVLFEERQSTSIEPLLGNAVHDVRVACYSVYKETDDGDLTVLCIQQYQFGEGAPYSYILSIRFPKG
jgi:hypothetical protein